MSGGKGKAPHPSHERATLLPMRDLEVVEDEEDEQSSVLMTAFILMTFASLGNRIFGKLQTYPMYNYPFFLSILSTFIYVPICFAYIVPVAAYGKAITREQRAIPKYKFFVMGALDSIAGMMQMFAVNFISNASMIVLLQQSAIPISMAISSFFLQARYTRFQYLGALVVCCGIFVVLAPSFAAGTHSPTPGEQDQQNQVIWSLTMVLSCIPMCLSSVYKEKALGEMDVDVIYLNGWVAVFQFLCALPLAIPSAYIMNLQLNDVPTNFYNGMLCFVGISSVHSASGKLHVDECEWAPVLVTLYMIFNLVYNILIIVVLKYGSANILWMSSTVMVPLGNVAFSLNFMPNHHSLRGTDLVGLACIMSGLILYRFYADMSSFISRCYKKSSSADEYCQRTAYNAKRSSTRRQASFVGLSQAEYLQCIIDTRVWNDQKAKLYRSPAQVRGSFLLRLGIPPSPQVVLKPSRTLLQTPPRPSRQPKTITPRLALSPPTRPTELSDANALINSHTNTTYGSVQKSEP